VREATGEGLLLRRTGGKGGERGWKGKGREMGFGRGRGDELAYSNVKL